MTLLATMQHILRLLIQSSEPTLKELLSDSAVKAVMEADGVDPLLLEAQPMPKPPASVAMKGSILRRTLISLYFVTASVLFSAR
jgi:hypothetical protein